MDTTETYKKMSDCEEMILQAPKLNEPNNFWGQPGFGIPSLHPIWLPRQDQLQGMLTDYKDFLGNLIDDFAFYCDENWDTLYNESISMEQLWLAFVMKSLYSKVWDGEKWIA